MADTETIQVAKSIIEISIEELEKESKKIFESQDIGQKRIEVEERARTFLTNYQLYENKRVKVGQFGVSSKMEAAIINSQRQLEIVRKSFYDFQNSLNEYYQMQVKVLFVFHTETNEPKIAIFDNNIEHLGVTHYGGLQYEMGEIEQILTEKDYDSTKLNATEKDIVFVRWVTAKQVIKKSRFLPILWKINGKWAGAKVNNLGTISEAYVKFYVNHFDKFTNDLEKNVCIFIRHPSYGVASVDNASGLLIGDVDNFPSLNLAVKKESASPMNMIKVKNAIEKILKEGPFDPDQMKKIFVEDIKTSKNQMSLLVKKELDDIVDLMIEKCGENIYDGQRKKFLL